jgi:hypothetical protein
MMSVRIEQHDKKCVSVATDGHRLIVATETDGTFAAGPTLLFSGADLKRALRSLRAPKHLLLLEPVGEFMDYSLAAPKGLSVDIKTSAADPKSFPPYQGIRRSSGSSAGAVGVNINYVGDFAKYLNRAKLDQCCTIQPGGPLDPIWIEYKSGTIEVQYAVMPLRH